MWVPEHAALQSAAHASTPHKRKNQRLQAVELELIAANWPAEALTRLQMELFHISQAGSLIMPGQASRRLGAQNVPASKSHEKAGSLTDAGGLVGRRDNCVSQS